MTFENWNLKSGITVAYMVAYATTVFLKNIFKKIVYLKDFGENSIFEYKIGKNSIFENKIEKTIYKIIPLKDIDFEILKYKCHSLSRHI